MQRTLERIQRVMDDPAERRTLRMRVHDDKKKEERRQWRAREAFYRAKLDDRSITSRDAVAKRAGAAASRAKQVAKTVAKEREGEMTRKRKQYERRQLDREKEETKRRHEQAQRQRASRWRTVLVHSLIMPHLERSVSLQRMDREDQLMLRHAILLISSAWRRCAERLRQKIRRRDGERQLRQSANLVSRFLRDHSSLAQGMNVVMGKYRRKVIHVQRMWRSFTAISIARTKVLRTVWDQLVEEEYEELLGHCAAQYVTDKRYGRQATLQDIVRNQSAAITELLRKRKNSKWRGAKFLSAVTSRLKQLRKTSLLLSDEEAHAREEAQAAGVAVKTAVEDDSEDSSDHGDQGDDADDNDDEQSGDSSPGDDSDDDDVHGVRDA